MYYSLGMKSLKIFIINSNTFNIYKTARKKFPPSCMECKHYLHPFDSPHFPMASCRRFKQIMPCKTARKYESLCGFEGNKFEMNSGNE